MRQYFQICQPPSFASKYQLNMELVMDQQKNPSKLRQDPLMLGRALLPQPWSPPLTSSLVFHFKKYEIGCHIPGTTTTHWTWEVKNKVLPSGRLVLVGKQTHTNTAKIPCDLAIMEVVAWYYRNTEERKCQSPKIDFTWKVLLSNKIHKNVPRYYFWVGEFRIFIFLFILSSF